MSLDTAAENECDGCHGQLGDFPTHINDQTYCGRYCADWHGAVEVDEE